MTQERAGMLRQDPLRQARTSVDTGSGEKRLATEMRQQHLGRGNFINFYEDLGISTTPEGAKLIREDEKVHTDYLSALDSNIAKNQGLNAKNTTALNSNQRLLDETNLNLGTLEEAFDTYTWEANNPSSTYKQPDWGEWADTEQRVGYRDGRYKYVTLLRKNGSTSGSWYMPKEAAAQLVGSDAYWVGGNSDHIHVRMKHDSLQAQVEKGFQAASDAFNNSLKQVYWNMVDAANIASIESNRIGYQEAADKLVEPIGILQGNQSTYLRSVTGVQGNIDATNLLIQQEQDTKSNAKISRENEWKDIHAKQKQKQDSMAEFFNSLNLGI